MATRPLALLVLSLLAAPVLAAQELWPRPLPGRGEVSLDWVRPSFEDETGLGFTRGVWTATGRFRVDSRGRLVVAVPYLTTGASDVGGGSATFGNPYLGYESADSAGKSIFIVGLRLPAAGSSEWAPEEMAFIGDYDRFEQALPKRLAVHAEGQAEAFRGDDGATVRYRLGATFLHYTGEAAGNANDFLFDYGLRFGRDEGDVAFGLSVTGRFFLSGGAGGSLAQRTTHQAGFDVAWQGPIRPRVALRIPLDAPLKGGGYRYEVTVGLTVPVQ